MKNKLFNRVTRNITLIWTMTDDRGFIRVMARIGKGDEAYVVKLRTIESKK